MVTTERTRDVYDVAVEYFTAHPREIADAWARPWDHPRGAIFDYLNASRVPDCECGCPSMVKSGSPVGRTAAPSLAERVRAIGLPDKIQMWNVREGETPAASIIDALPLFAEAQRLGDELIPGRVKPTKGVSPCPAS